MRLQPTALILILLLEACAPVNSSVCPLVVEYSKKDQNIAADELTTCNCPMLIEMMKDNKVLRDQARVCKK